MCVMGFHLANFGLHMPFRSRDRSRHATDRQTDGQTDGRRYTDNHFIMPTNCTDKIDENECKQGV